jgi:hypothetical protein
MFAGQMVYSDVLSSARWGGHLAKSVTATANQRGSVSGELCVPWVSSYAVINNVLTILTIVLLSPLGSKTMTYHLVIRPTQFLSPVAEGWDPIRP